jgi:hypothetical protein
MSSDPNSYANMGRDPFTAFWQDVAGRMMSAGIPAAPANPSLETMNQMRRVFFDALAQHSEQFMRSEAFLKAMKQAMDASLAWQQTLSQTMQKGLGAAQMPSRTDVEHLTGLVHGFEERMNRKLDELSARIAALESAGGREGAPQQRMNGAAAPKNRK